MVVKELIALLGVQTDDQSVKQGANAINNLIGLAKAAGAAFAGFLTIQGIKGAVVDIARIGEGLEDLKNRTGIATDLLQKLGYAAELTGASMGDVSTGIRKLQIAQVEASKGTKAQAETFKKLGVDIKGQDGKLKSSEQLLFEVSDGLTALGTDAERTAAAVKLFGRGGQALVPMLKTGGQGLRDMMLEAEGLGGMLSSDLVEAGDRFMDNQQRMKMAMQGVKTSIATSMLPALNRLTDGFLQWWRVNGKIIRQAVARIFERLANVLLKVGTFVGKVVAWFVKFWTTLNPMSKKILLLTAGLLAFVKIMRMGAWGKWLLIITAILLAIEDFQTFLEGGNSALGRFLNWVKKVTGIDFAPWIREAAQAFSILAADQEPFDWATYFQEVGKVVDSYLAAAGQTWSDWWNTFYSWYSAAFVDTVVANFFSALLNVLGTWIDQASNLVYAFFDFLLKVWDEPKAAFLSLIDAWKVAWYDFYESIRSTVGIIFDWFNQIGGWLSEKGGKVLEFLGIKEKAGPAQPTPSPLLKGAAAVAGGVAAGATTIPGAVGGVGGVGPYMTPAAPTGSTVYNAPTSMSFTVNAAPGMNEDLLAQKTAQKARGELEKQNRRALHALVPRKAT